jgi:hypothetical protein
VLRRATASAAMVRAVATPVGERHASRAWSVAPSGPWSGCAGWRHALCESQARGLGMPAVGTGTNARFAPCSKTGTNPHRAGPHLTS